MRHRLCIADYHRLGEAGVLREDDHIELIEGELIDMAPIGSRHADCVSRLNRLFVRQTEAVVRVQDPIQLSLHSEPEPDIAIVRSRRYSKAHPGPDDVLLLVEVADSSLAYDRDIKVPLYARHGIPELWLVDLEHERLEVYLGPTAQGYRQTLRPRGQEIIVASRVPELRLEVSLLWS
jgi:Uma2 family endonuclease